VNRRIKATLSQGLKVIFCIGETLSEREKGKTFSVIERQVEVGLKGFGDKEIENMVIAYEPVWAIGTGKQPLQNRLRRCIDHQGEIGKLYSREVSDKIRIQYGGSVTQRTSKD